MRKDRDVGRAGTGKGIKNHYTQSHRLFGERILVRTPKTNTPNESWVAGQW